MTEERIEVRMRREWIEYLKSLSMTTLLDVYASEYAKSQLLKYLRQAKGYEDSKVFYILARQEIDKRLSILLNMPEKS